MVPAVLKVKIFVKLLLSKVVKLKNRYIL